MHNYYMNLALKLASKGKGKVNPNPMVGAIIVKDFEIIGEGYHKRYGEHHAEINAINNAKKDIAGATMYVTLEPCVHKGKTPPCVDKIIEKKISRVVVGMVDPNKLVSGKGIQKLRDNGIEVITGVLEDECIKLNEIFIKYMTKGRPFVAMKIAMSLDGKIATSYGESKWITGKEARKEVHKLRSELMGIMVGANTVIKDNPRLTCRVEDGKNPIRIIVDSTLRVPLTSNVFKNLNDAETIVATTNKASKENIEILENMGVRVLIIESKDGKVNLNKLLIKLAELDIDSILLEGGATLNYSALQAGVVDKVLVYTAPKIIGGINAPGSIGGEGISILAEAYNIKKINTRMVGQDVLIEGYIKETN